jgi:hypothetical protein
MSFLEGLRTIDIIYFIFLLIICLINLKQILFEILRYQGLSTFTCSSHVHESAELLWIRLINRMNAALIFCILKCALSHEIQKILILNEQRSLIL